MNAGGGDKSNQGIGLILFFIYLAIYAVFVFLSAFRGDLMARHAFGGVNVAVVYGFALIVLPLVLALLYLYLARRNDKGGEGGA